jgi:hypothetical protein
MKKQILFYGSVLLSTMLLTGCGSDDKPDGNVVTKGEASMSILLEGRVQLDTTRGCQKLFVVHAVDGNGNPIPGLSVDANIIINPKAAGNSVGTIQTTAPITFSDLRYNFNAQQVVPGENLIILPTKDRYHTSYLGDWKINKVEGSSVTLSGAAYNLETTDMLSYVIGNESTYVQGYGTAVAHVERPDTNGSKVTNDKGYAYFDVIYDIALIGHPYTVGAHSGNGYRMGAAVSGILPNCIVKDKTEKEIPDTNTTK